VPEFTELEWTIVPQLTEWAEVATYDPPGVGQEALRDEDVDAVRRGERRVRELFVRRGLEEIERRGWDRFFVVGDAWGTASAVRIALECHDRLQGMALGHASLTYDMEGEHAAINREIWAAMRQLLRQDHREFIRYGIVQATQGSVDEDVAKRMLDRFPDRELIEFVWDALASEHEPIGEMVGQLDCPLLLAQHVGCLGFTEVGFEDAVAAFPDARVVRVPESPGSSTEFARALRVFCEEVALQRAR
jgi:pimeloyl-ACP methyl ester carboxylesterase